MSKFHVNGKGEPGVCRATANCPFGGENEHFSSKEEARAAYETSMASSFTASLADGRNAAVKHRKAAIKARDEMLATWGSSGFKKLSDLTDEEFDIVDARLERINTHLYVGGEPTNKLSKILRPYSRLYTYSPHMKGNKGRWVKQELKYDHETGNIYGITEVTTPVGFWSTAHVTVAKVKNYGHDIESAITDSQKTADETFEKFMRDDNLGQNATFAPRPFEPIVADDKNVHEYEENKITEDRELIKLELTKGLKEAKAWNKAVRERTRLSEDKEEFLRSAGY